MNITIKRTKRNGKIEFLRFLCAVVVMMRHARFFPDEITRYFQRGALAVEFFFIVSGYLMACACKKSMDSEIQKPLGEESFNYVRRKFCGLMPEFLFAWLLSFFISQVSQRKFGILEMISELRTWIWELFPISMAGFTGDSFHMGAWYISAMLLAMLILYPICRKHFDIYTRIIAPLLSIFIIGYMAYNFHTVIGPVRRIGTWTFRGLPRAIAMISLGAASYPLIEWLKNLNLTKLGKILITVVALISSIGMFGWMILGKTNKYDILCIGMIWIVCCLAFSHQSLLADKWDNPISLWLGKLSMLIYMCHGEMAKAIDREWKRLVKKEYIGTNPLEECIVTFIIYFILTGIMIFMVYQLSNWVRKHQDSIKNQVVSGLIK